MEDQPVKSNIKKKIITIIYSLVILSVIIIMTIYTSQYLNNNNISESSKLYIPTKEKADELKKQAIQSKKDKNFSKAKTLLQESKDLYEKIQDENNINDIEIMLTTISQLENDPTIVESSPLRTN